MSTPSLPSPAWMSCGLPALPRHPAANVGARTLTRAENDVDAVSGWLLRHQSSPHTFDSYKREAERLLAWCVSRSQTLSMLMAEDLVAYQQFLQDPQPRETWCLQSEPRYLAPGVANPDWQSLRRPARYLADGSPNPTWRPFVSGLSPSAAKQAVTILFGLFEYLCAIGYLAGNPLRAARTRATRPRQQTVQRYLGQESWQFVLEHLESWPRATAREVAHYQRTKFLISFLYLTGLRRNEIAQASTADLVQRRGQWWLHVSGKGHTGLPVPVAQDALQALQTYRISLGRSPWPNPHQPEPLLMDLYGKGRQLTSKAVHQIVTALFDSAAKACPDPEQARLLQSATTHWLRHTAATHQLDAGIPLLVVRDNLRHASVQTTERYLHVDPDRQHAQTQKHRLRPGGE
jgi:integrase